MEEVERAGQRVEVVDIVASTTVSARVDDETGHVRSTEVDTEAQAQRTDSRRSHQFTEVNRKRISVFSCVLGLFATVVGTALVIMFLMAEFSSSMQEILSHQSLVIPGFVLLFLGVIGLIVGIYFCWIYKRRSRERRYVNRNDELEAGFHLPRRRANQGYINNAMVPDEPPSYHSVAVGGTSPHVLPDSGESSAKLPSYLDAVKLEKKIPNKKSDNESRDDDVTELPPPPYANEKNEF